MPFRHARHTRVVWQYRHAMALSGPLATHPDTSRNRLPPASPPRCDGTEAKVSHLHSINKRLTAHRRNDAGVDAARLPVMADEGAFSKRARTPTGMLQKPTGPWRIATQRL